MNKRTLPGFVFAVFGSTLIIAPPVSADNTVCRGVIGAVTVDNIVVPNGAVCTLNGTRVEGNVFVLTGATLRAQAIEVDGNLQAAGHRSVTVTGDSFFGGGVQIKQGMRAVLDRVTVNGNVQVEQNTGTIHLSRNSVYANMQVNQNTGGVRIVLNEIAQALQCQANSPAPTGGGNIAGDKEDQCARL